jgi:hypothetical protein
MAAARVRQGQLGENGVGLLRPGSGGAPSLGEGTLPVLVTAPGGGTRRNESGALAAN